MNQKFKNVIHNIFGLFLEEKHVKTERAKSGSASPEKDYVKLTFNTDMTCHDVLYLKVYYGYCVF